MREEKAGKHSKKRAKPFLNIAIIVCALGALICVGILLSSYFEYKKGDNLILAAFGGGYTWGAEYVKWAYDGGDFSK